MTQHDKKLEYGTIPVFGRIAAYRNLTKRELDHFSLYVEEINIIYDLDAQIDEKIALLAQKLATLRGKITRTSPYVYTREDMASRKALCLAAGMIQDLLLMN